MRPTPINFIKCLMVVLLMAASVACETNSAESIFGRGKVRALIAELHKAKTCGVCRVDDSHPGGNKLNKGSKIHGFLVLSEVKPMKAESREALSQILLNPNTYFEHSIPVDCGFRPGIAFRFSGGTIDVDLLVCFSCRELRYYLDGKLAGGSHFESLEFLALTKRLFPDDKKIQTLK